jgi:hypothetical protein
MRKIVMRTVLGALAGVVLTAGTAAAADVLEAKVPFPFVVNGKSFPAGEYRIERANMGESVLLIRSDHGKPVGAFVATRRAENQSPSGSQPALQFTRHENTYKLSAVWAGADEGMELMD